MKTLFRHSIILIGIIVFSSVLSAGADRKLTFLVQPFQLNGDKSMSWISSGMTDTVTADMTKIHDLNVVTPDDRKMAIREIELSMTGLIAESDAPKVGRLAGAQLILSGSCTLDKNNIRVVVKVIQVESGKVLASVKLDDSMDNIIALQDKIVRAVMDEAKNFTQPGFIVPAIDDADRSRIDSKSKPTLPAYESYARAIELAEKDPRSALQLSNAALSKKPDYVEALLLSGWIESSMGNTKKALELFDRGLRVLEKRNQSQSIDAATLMVNRGIALWNAKQFDDALKSYTDAQALFIKNGMTESGTYATILTNLGATYRSKGDLDNALSLSLQGKAVWEKLDLRKSSGYAWTLSNIGVIYTLKNDSKNALAMYADALKTWNALGLKNSQGYAMTSCQVGVLLYNQGKQSESLAPLLEGVTISDRLGFNTDDNHGWFCWYLALAYLNGKKDPCKAVPYMEKTVAIFQKNNNPEAQKARDALNTMRSMCGK
jgi:TolB-like protein